MRATSMILYASIIIAVICILFYCSSEGFSSKREKADKIVDWFQENDKPKYADFRDSLQKTDIVEYTEAKKLYYDGNLNSNNMEKKL